MPKSIDVRVTPKEHQNEVLLKTLVADKLDIAETDIDSIKILKRSIDARGRKPMYQLRIEVSLNGEVSIISPQLFDYHKNNTTKDGRLTPGDRMDVLIAIFKKRILVHQLMPSKHVKGTSLSTPLFETVPCEPEIFGEVPAPHPGDGETQPLVRL